MTEPTARCSKCKCFLTFDKFDKNPKGQLKRTCVKCLNIVKAYNKDLRNTIKQQQYDEIVENYICVKQMFIDIGYNCLERGKMFNTNVKSKSLFIDLIMPSRYDENIHEFYRKHFKMCVAPNLKHYTIILIISFDMNFSTIVLSYDYTAFLGFINRTVGGKECNVCFEDDTSAGYVCTRCSKYLCQECYMNNNREFFKPCHYCNYSFKD